MTNVELFIERMQKACHQATASAIDLLRKSQMGFDFGPSTPNPHANHKAYQRVNARGTVSQIKQLGSPHEQRVAELHEAFERHDKKGRGGMGISTTHPDYATPEKYAATAKNILKFKGHERLGKQGAAEVEGMLQRHIGEIDRAAEDKATSDHNEWRHQQELANTARGEVVPLPDGKLGTVIAGLEKVAADFLANPAMAEYRISIQRKMDGLRKNPTAKYAIEVGKDLQMFAEKAKNEQPVVVQPAKVDAGFKIPPPPGHVVPPPSSVQGGATMKSYKSAATAKAGMKEGDTIVAAKDGGVFIHRMDAGAKVTAKYRLIGPNEEKTFGNKTNPHWQALVDDDKTPLSNLDKLTDEGLSQLLVGFASTGDTARITQIGEEIAHRNAAKGPAHDHYGVEAHGQKGMQNKPWRKTFASAAHFDAWAEKNDVEVHAQRDLERGEAHPQSKGARETAKKPNPSLAKPILRTAPAPKMEAGDIVRISQGPGSSQLGEVEDYGTGKPLVRFPGGMGAREIKPGEVIAHHKPGSAEHAAVVRQGNPHGLKQGQFAKDGFGNRYMLLQEPNSFGDVTAISAGDAIKSGGQSGVGHAVKAKYLEPIPAPAGYQEKKK